MDTRKNITNIEKIDMPNKIYLDTNIILDYLFEQRRDNEYSKNFLLDFAKKDYIFVTNNLNLNTIFYIGTSYYKQYEKIKEFLKYIHSDKSQWEIYNLTDMDREFAFAYMDEHFGADFEDLQQYISAKNSNCEFIVTNDKNFPKLDLPLKRTNPKIKE